MEQEGKLSRQQRRALERELQKTLKATTVERPQAKGSLFSADNQVIVQEAKRLGIQISPNEERLWRSYQESPNLNYMSENFREATWSKVEKTLGLMQMSENPYFSTTAAYYTEALQKYEMGVYVQPTLSVDSSGLEGGMASALSVADDRVIPTLILSADTTLNKQSHLMTAFNLVHERVHLKLLSREAEAIDVAAPLERQLFELDERKKSLGTTLPEEAEAYATQAQALIHQFGLGRFRVLSQTMQEAAYFVRFGKNPLDKRWQEYIKAMNLNYLQ